MTVIIDLYFNENKTIWAGLKVIGGMVDTYQPISEEPVEIIAEMGITAMQSS
jgi:hypothetical protein